jgi:hypothetical protein
MRNATYQGHINSTKCTSSLHGTALVRANSLRLIHCPKDMWMLELEQAKDFDVPITSEESESLVST